MFDLYKYLSEHLAGDDYIKTVYICTGIGRMEELMQNARDIRTPCVLVDIGVDGAMNVDDRDDLQTYHTFYILESNQMASAAEINTILQRTKRYGLRITRLMARQSYDPADPCYGMDRSNVGFSAIGPVGAYCYGYSFGLTFHCDYE